MCITFSTSKTNTIFLTNFIISFSFFPKLLFLQKHAFDLYHMMKLFFITLFISLCHSFEQSSNSKDYVKLVQFANLASVAYCVTKGLSTGVLSDPDTHCPLNACKNSILQDVEIVRIFDFNRLNEVGTGFYALDHRRKAIILVLEDPPHDVTGLQI